MQPEQKAFRIYDASAGSGKTFTLAREYLKLLLRSEARLACRQILAITFTNKAVGELKARILSSLMSFSALEDPDKAPPMFRAVQDALGVEAPALIARSRRVLQELLHNYAFFDVSTIDRFNHRILRTFSQDLNLPAGFEVVLDTDALLLQAVDTLVARAGNHPGLTEVLVDFALEKAEEDRHWDISRDLFEMGKLLFDENHFPFLEALSDKGLDEFLDLKRNLAARRGQTRSALMRLAGEVLSLMRDNGLETSDFTRGSFPKFIGQIAKGELDQDFDAQWKQNFGQEPLYPKRAPAGKQRVLDGLLPQFSACFQEIRQKIHHLDFLSNAYQNLAPFTVLGMLQQELHKLREEEGYLPISSFNAIIARELRDQPAPYIYERLGERYRHYFIDEFQDTSELQWTNLVPLIGSALQGEDEQGEQGSLVLVGDAKQAIYRWRGGKAEQFLSLIDGSGNPFSLKAQIEALPRNYRSHRQIIEFNNDFFRHISTYMNQGSYSELFQKASGQLYEQDRPGLVCLDFIPPGEESPLEAYLGKTLGILRDLQEKGYAYRDVCILTRKRQEGVLVSAHLMKAGVPVISSETLLLKNHPGVQFLIHLLNYLLAPDDRNHAFGMLRYLSEDRPDRHDWMSKHLDRMEEFLWESYDFDPRLWMVKPLYELLEEAIRLFGLAGEADAYLIFLMDLVLEVSRDQQASIQAFLDYWEARQDEISILAPQGFDAVTLMTIHKSKGLEFPVVIYPFADTPIFWDRNAKIWLPVAPEDFSGFSHVLVSKKKALLHYGDPAPAYYLREQEKLELDAYNLLYVAHTRAIKALYIITRGRKGSDAGGDPLYYGDLYTRYLREKGLWEEGRERYSFGALDPEHAPGGLSDREPVVFRYTARDRTPLRVVTKSGQLWGSEQEKALSRGTVLHLALSLVGTAGDIEPVLERLVSDGYLSRGESGPLRQTLLAVVEHPLLLPYFQPGVQVFNEREILTENGLILRPDRMVLRRERVAVIDYKTGARRPQHREQVTAYCRALQATGRSIEAAIVVYISAGQVTPEFL